MSDQIEFITRDKWKGIIPEPEPASKNLPAWFQNLPLERDGGNNRTKLDNSTVKACISFLEAMKTGWILKTPCDIYVNVKGTDFKTEYKFDTKMTSGFPMSTVGDAFPMDGPIIKFNGLWRINAPDGYSMLFTHPINQFNETRFQCTSGIISIDNFDRRINHPVIWTAGDWEGVIPKGTPVMQCIPFERDSMIAEATVRSSTEEENEEMFDAVRMKRSEQRNYRDNDWEPVEASKNKRE